MKTPEAIRAAAHAWCEAWNARDLDAVMTHYADDVELNSPTVVARWGMPTAGCAGIRPYAPTSRLGCARPTSASSSSMC